MTRRQTAQLLLFLLTLPLAGCVTTVNNSLPFSRLPAIALASDVRLVASPAHPTAFLGDVIPGGSRVEVLGRDENAAWLLVLHGDSLGWMPTIFSRTNVGTLQTALVGEPTSAQCTSYLGSISDQEDVWSSAHNGSVLAIGAIYRPQIDVGFADSTLSASIDNGGRASVADYLHVQVTPTSALVLFAFSLQDLQQQSLVRFQLANAGDEGIVFQAAFFSVDCPAYLAGWQSTYSQRLPVGILNRELAENNNTMQLVPIAPAAPSPSRPVESAVSPAGVTSAPGSLTGPIRRESGPALIYESDINSYRPGSQTLDFGLNLAIRAGEEDQYITGINPNGRLLVDGLALAGNFEVVMRADWGSSWPLASLQIESGVEEPLFELIQGVVHFGTTRKAWNSTGWLSGQAVNEIRLKAQGTELKLSINAQALGSIPIDASAVFTGFQLTGLGSDDRLFGLEIWEDVGTVRVAPRPASTSGPSADAASANLDSSGTLTGTVLSPILSARRGPGLQYARVDQLYQNAPLTITGKTCPSSGSPTWYLIGGLADEQRWIPDAPELVHVVDSAKVPCLLPQRIAPLTATQPLTGTPPLTYPHSITETTALAVYAEAVTAFRLAEEAALRWPDTVAVDQMADYAQGQALVQVRTQASQLRSRRMYAEQKSTKFNVQLAVLLGAESAGVLVEETRITITYRPISRAARRAIAEEEVSATFVYDLTHTEAQWRVARIVELGK